MRIADLILPVFAVIVTGWIVGYTGYLSRTLSDALIHSPTTSQCRHY